MTNAPAFIRTYVPLVVSYLVGWLASVNIEVSESQQTALSGLIGTVVAAAYYAAVRWAEVRFPWASRFLGSTKQPAAYEKSTVVVQEISADEADEFEDLDEDDLGPDFDEAAAADEKVEA